jgi:hypothetical protein
MQPCIVTPINHELIPTYLMTTRNIFANEQSMKPQSKYTASTHFPRPTEAEPPYYCENHQPFPGACAWKNTIFQAHFFETPFLEVTTLDRIVLRHVLTVAARENRELVGMFRWGCVHGHGQAA